MRLFRSIILLGAAAAVTLALEAPAGATVNELSRFDLTDTRTFDAPGCRLTDTMTLDEEFRGQAVVVNGSVHTRVLYSGTVTFDESGEHFSGSYSLPFTLSGQPDGSVVWTGSYTAVAFGDKGDTAVLHHNIHVAFFAPDRLDVSISNLEHHCT